MNDDQLRKEFAEIISNFPYEYSLERFPENASKWAWPGQYRIIHVQLGWEMFKQGHALGEQRPDCGTCANRGKVYGRSAETYCDHCVHHSVGRQDNYAPKPPSLTVAEGPHER